MKYLIILILFSGSLARAEQINALRFKQAFSSDAFYVEDGLDGRKGLGLEYKGIFSLNYEYAEDLIPVVNEGGQEKINELVDSFQRVRLSGGYFINKRWFLGLSLPFDQVNSLSPFDSTNGNNDLDNLTYQDSNWTLGDVTLTSKYRLFNLDDKYNWTLISSVTLPTGDDSIFNTDDSFSGSVGLAFTKHVSEKTKFYGNFQYLYAGNSEVNVNDEFKTLDATQRILLGAGVNRKLTKSIQGFTEFATQINYPVDRFQNPIAVNLGANINYKNILLTAGVGLENLLDDQHYENRFFLGARYNFGKRKNIKREVIDKKENKIVNNIYNFNELESLLSIAKRVHFQTGKDVLIPIYYEKLDRVIVKIKSMQDSIKSIKIEGHTDLRGESSKNLALSLKRAQALKDYFVKRGGLPETMFSVVGKGESMPLVEEVDSFSERINRRVEFYVEEAD